MKKLFGFSVLFVIVSIVWFGCTKKENKSSTNTASQPGEYVYDPGPAWILSWGDEFNGESIDTKTWNRQVEPAGRFNDEWQRYTSSPENAYIEDGCMIIRAQHESDQHGRDQYSSARMNTANKKSWKYGKIAARIKLPYGKGIWPAFWMLGANISENGGDTPWPQCGEVDILEMYGSRDDGMVEANIHYANASNRHEMMGTKAFKLKEGRFADDFHIFELEWDPDGFAWLVNGIQYASTPISSAEFSEFHKEFFILFNIAVGGRAAGRPDGSTEFPQHMYIDWVRVYKRA